MRNSATNNALELWKVAHATLASAIGAYIEACSSLESFCKTASGGGEKESLEDICYAVEDQVHVLISYERALCLARTGLQRQRNASSRLSVVGRLPHEILTIVFTSAVASDRVDRVMSHPKPHSVDFANVLASVCSYWRRVAIDIPDLWTYIDLSRRGSLDHASLWLERTCSKALDIRIGTDTSPADLHHIPSTFLSSITRARSLLLRGDRDSVDRWLLEWYRNGIPGATTSLAIHPTLDDRRPISFPDPTMLPQSRLNELVRPISVLYLCCIAVSWSELPFQNLSVLCLAGLADSGLSIGVLSTILLASPRLLCLRLARTNIWNGGRSHSEQNITPISLEHLETLEISDMRENDAIRALSIIAPGNQALTLAIRRVCVGRHDIMEATLISFLQRSNITTFLFGPHATYFSPKMILALPNIEVLFLVSIAISAEFSGSIAPESSSPHSVRTYWPKLHTFEAAGCEFKDIIGFKRLLSACPIRELRINVECIISFPAGDQRDHGSTDFSDWAGPGVKFSYDCREWEVGYVPFR
ncbi:hypothetical protein BDV93DRAFT_563529 [Ceratobasidium sp. AG-I]|nr:hypothetical protein BDV93DRAFT_563529 [Ceratobasidium sp. AG-I]